MNSSARSELIIIVPGMNEITGRQLKTIIAFDRILIVNVVVLKFRTSVELWYALQRDQSNNPLAATLVAGSRDAPFPRWRVLA